MRRFQQRPTINANRITTNTLIVALIGIAPAAALIVILTDDDDVDTVGDAF